ncbi:MAG: hypothetical protein O2931_16630 [Planctomycetota bacterium]|nr:hypothetical protein [Planctomycetota bacterium]MDA1180407.1 hypothetical protein [Planctomycetota bacterium]
MVHRSTLRLAAFDRLSIETQLATPRDDHTDARQALLLWQDIDTRCETAAEAILIWFLSNMPEHLAHAPTIGTQTTEAELQRDAIDWRPCQKA